MGLHPHSPGQDVASTTDVDVLIKSMRAVRLRGAGLSYSEIAAELGTSVGTAFNHVKRQYDELREVAHESAAQAREIELERLDAKLAKLTEKLAHQTREIEIDDPATPGTKIKVTIPDPQESTIRAMLDISKARRELLGLDAPSRSQIGGDPDGVPIPIMAIDGREVLLARMKQMLAREAKVVMPDAATALADDPTLASPLLAISANGNGNGTHPTENGNGKHDGT